MEWMNLQRNSIATEWWWLWYEYECEWRWFIWSNNVMLQQGQMPFLSIVCLLLHKEFVSYSYVRTIELWKIVCCIDTKTKNTKNPLNMQNCLRGNYYYRQLHLFCTWLMDLNIFWKHIIRRRFHLKQERERERARENKK